MQKYDIYFDYASEIKIIFFKIYCKTYFGAVKRLISIIFASSSSCEKREKNRTHLKEMRAKLRAICCGLLRYIAQHKIINV